MALDKGPVDLSPWYSADTENYLIAADRRIVTGFRAAIEMVGQPVPSAAVRRSSVRNGIARILRDYHADNPVEALRDRQAKLEAGIGGRARTSTEILQSGADDLLKGLYPDD